MVPLPAAAIILKAVAGPFKQIFWGVMDGWVVTTGVSFTTTVTSLVSGQPAAVRLDTVYKVVITGEAVTVAPLLALNVVVGDQLYIPLPPVAVKFILWPVQIAGAVGLTFKTFTPELAAMLKVELSLLNPSVIM